MKALYKAIVTRGKKGLHPINIGHRWADHSLVDLHRYSSAVRASGVDDTPWIEIMLVKGGKCPSKCLLPPDNWVDVYMMLQNWHKRINILLYVEDMLPTTRKRFLPPTPEFWRNRFQSFTAVSKLYFFFISSLCIHHQSSYPTTVKRQNCAVMNN
jgi:hypothetical protein